MSGVRSTTRRISGTTWARIGSPAAASNVGSFLALISYPFVVEPLTRLVVGEVDQRVQELAALLVGARVHRQVHVGELSRLGRPAVQEVVLHPEDVADVAPRQPTLGDLRADAGRRVEGGDPRAAGAQPLREGALGPELDLELAGEELPGELPVLPDVGGDDARDAVVGEAVVGVHFDGLHAGARLPAGVLPAMSAAVPSTVRGRAGGYRLVMAPEAINVQVSSFPWL